MEQNGLKLLHFQLLKHLNLLHSVVLLGCGEDPLVSHINLTERPAAVPLLVEQWYGSHDDGTNYYGLAVGHDGLFCHHVTHVLDVPATEQQS